MPSVIATGLPGFSTLRSLIVDGFRLILVTAAQPAPVVPAKLPGVAVFAPAP